MDMSERFYIIDGTAYAYRAYHAISGLRTSTGIPTNAIYGFTTMMLKLLRQEKPEYMAVVFDAGGSEKREELFQEYKANRPETPDDFIQQIPFIIEVTEALGVKFIEIEGVEADDIIGTLARMAERKGIDVQIISSDKDMLQLVSEKVKVRSIHRENFIYDEERVKERLGVEPARIPDLLGLMGDPVDNIPGVKGVGVKTALPLLQRYGTLENLLDHLDEIESKSLRRKLITGADMARLSKELATIDVNVPLEITLDELRVKNPDHDKLLDLFMQLEFNSLLDEIKALKPSQDELPLEYHTVMSEEELDEVIRRIEEAGEFAIDLETTSLDPMKAEIVGISISVKPREAFYIPIYHSYIGAPKLLPKELVLEKLRPYIESRDYGKIGQNIKYDLEVLWQSGVKMEGLNFDTMLASYVLNPTASHNLDNLAMVHLDRTMISIDELIGKGKDQISMSQVSVEDVSRYACEDAEVTYELKAVLEKKLKEQGLERVFYEIEMPLVPVLAEMEMTGVKVDVDYLRGLSREMGAKLRELAGKIYELAGEEFNIGSPKQLGRILFEKLKLPRKRRTKTGYSTNERVLRSLSQLHELPALVLEYRHFSTLKSTFVDNLPQLINPKTGRIHTDFNQAATATGRLSSSNPNLQNIPVRSEEGRQIRRAFIPSQEGWLLLVADYSQVELRILAHITGDERLVEAFQKGLDIHSATASLIFDVPIDQVTPDMRRKAKTINFGIIYGMGANRLSQELRISYGEAKRFIESYFKTYPGIQAYLEQTVKDALENGYVTTLLGRRRYIPEIRSAKQVTAEYGKRLAINTPIQGTAADIIKLAMIKIHDYLKSTGKRAKMILQVHDELVFDLPEDEVDEVRDKVREIMEGVLPMRVPLKVDINVGENWLEAK